MNDKFLSQIDRVVRKVDVLNRMVDAVAGRLLPNVEAQAVCGNGYQCGTSWYEGICGTRCNYATCYIEYHYWKKTRYAYSGQNCGYTCVDTWCDGAWFNSGNQCPVC